jgi:hypothetical protein
MIPEERSPQGIVGSVTWSEQRKGPTSVGHPKNAQRAPLCRKLERSPTGEASDLIAFAFAINFLLPFSAQKSHVKHQNPLTPYNPSTPAWHFGYLQPAILDIYRQKQASPGHKSGLTPLEKDFSYNPFTMTILQR